MDFENYAEEVIEDVEAIVEEEVSASETNQQQNHTRSKNTVTEITGRFDKIMVETTHCQPE